MTNDVSYVTQEMWDRAQAALRAALPVIEQHTPPLSTAGTMVSLREQVKAAIAGASVKPPSEWKVRVHESSDAMWLKVYGPEGQQAAFEVPKDSVRAEVLRQYGLRPENRPEATNSTIGESNG